MKILLMILVLFLASCSGEETPTEEGGGSSSTSKALFSNWTNKVNGSEVDLTGGEFDEILLLTNVLVEVDADWVAILTAAGRTNIPTAGEIYICDYIFYIIGNESSGAFVLETDDETDSYANNACLYLDNNCGEGSLCHYYADHSYVKSGSTLTVDWFNTADSGLIGTDSFE